MNRIPPPRRALTVEGHLTVGGQCATGRLYRVATGCGTLLSPRARRIGLCSMCSPAEKGVKRRD